MGSDERNCSKRRQHRTKRPAIHSHRHIGSSTDGKCFRNDVDVICPACSREYERIKHRRLQLIETRRNREFIESSTIVAPSTARMYSDMNNGRRTNLSAPLQEQVVNDGSGDGDHTSNLVHNTVPSSGNTDVTQRQEIAVTGTSTDYNRSRTTASENSYSVDFSSQRVLLPDQLQLPAPQPSLALRRPLNDREQFLLFIKILLKLLAQEPELDPVLRRAKMVVGDCTRRNRNHEPEFLHLSDAIESHLQQVVSERIWTKAKDMFHYFLSNQQRQRERQEEQRQESSVTT